MSAFLRFLDAASGFTNTAINAGSQLYKMDAERKFYDAQNMIQNNISQFMMGLETDPDYGDVMLEDEETYARTQFAAAGYDYSQLANAEPGSELDQLGQQISSQYQQMVQDSEHTGYTAKFDKLIGTLQSQVGKISNPMAQEEAQRYLDSVRRQAGAEVYNMQVTAWKRDLVAKESTDMDKFATSGAPPEQIMEYVTQRLDRMQSVNAITPAQYESALTNYATAALGTSLSNNAMAVLEGGTIHDARKFLNEADGSFMFGGREYFVTDQAKAIANQKVEQTWNAIQESENERLQQIYQTGGLKMADVNSAKLDYTYKWQWESKLRAAEVAAGNTGMSTADMKDTVGTLVRMTMLGEQSPNGAFNLVHSWVDNNLVTQGHGMDIINDYSNELKKQFPRYGDLITQHIDSFNAIARNQFKAKNDIELKANPAYTEALTYYTIALQDMVYSQSLRGATSDEFRSILADYTNKAIGMYIDMKREGYMSIGQGSEARDFARLHDWLEAEGEHLVTFDDRLGTTVWQGDAKRRYDQDGNHGALLAERDYGIKMGTVGPNGQILTQYTPERAMDALGNISERPIPIYHDNNGNNYRYFNKDGTMILHKKESNGTWAALTPTVAIQRAEELARTRAAVQTQVDSAFNLQRTTGGVTPTAEIELPMPDAFIRYTGESRTNAEKLWQRYTQVQKDQFYKDKNIEIPAAPAQAVTGTSTHTWKAPSF